MIKIEEQYLLVELGEANSPNTTRIIEELTESKHNNVLLVVPSKVNDLNEIVTALNICLQSSNGLACCVGKKESKTENDFKELDHVIWLFTEHEGVEAIMMNILENEFLNAEE